MTFNDLKHSLHDLDRDQVFATLGMESRRSTLEKATYAMALVGTGVLVGAGLGLMFAPRAGQQLREDLRLRMRRVKPNGHDPAMSTDGARPS